MQTQIFKPNKKHHRQNPNCHHHPQSPCYHHKPLYYITTQHRSHPNHPQKPLQLPLDKTPLPNTQATKKTHPYAHRSQLIHMPTDLNSIEKNPRSSEPETQTTMPPAPHQNLAHLSWQRSHQRSPNCIAARIDVTPISQYCMSLLHLIHAC